MKRMIDLKEISDGRLYSSGDMVKADCHDCTGCSDCCRGMGSSIILDPMDIWRFRRGIGKDFAALMEGDIELSVVDGMILPNLKMDSRRDACPFLDENGRFLESINSGLNNCLTLEANIDQTSRAFIQDVVISMFDEGCVAIVPVDTSSDPEKGSFEIETLRTGKIIEWYPRHVKVRVYNDRTGQKEDVILSKKSVAIIENPLFAVINEPNSTMQRLIRKLNLLDYIDEQSGSGKLDLIIQLPYVVKTDTKRQQAEQRRKDIEEQLTGTKYGIAYTDATERITQLNRPVENNLMKQIEYLTSMLNSQLGITTTIMDGTADEKTMLNYNNRTVEPIVSAIVDAMKRTFLTKTARSQKQSIMFFKDPFKLVPVNDLAEIADKFTRNEIMTSNEIRQIVGMKPSDDPRADELRNANINQSNEELAEINNNPNSNGTAEEQSRQIIERLDRKKGTNSVKEE